MGVLKTICCERAFCCIPLRYATALLSFINLVAGVAIIVFFALINGWQFFSEYINLFLCRRLNGDDFDCSIDEDTRLYANPEQQEPLNTLRAWIGLSLGIICFIVGFLAIFGNKERVPCLLYIYIFGAILILVTGCAMEIAVLVRLKPAKRVIVEASLAMVAAALVIGYSCLVVGLRCREMRHRDCK